VPGRQWWCPERVQVKGNWGAKAAKKVCVTKKPEYAGVNEKGSIVDGECLGGTGVPPKGGDLTSKR